MKLVPCPLCAEGSWKTLLAFTADRAVAAKVSRVLTQREIPFSGNASLFVLEPQDSEEEYEIVGALHCSLNEAERREVRVSARTLESIFGAETLDVYFQRHRTKWFDRAWRDDRFTFYFQPIVDVPGARVVAHEALVRLEGERIYSGAEIMAAAMMRQTTRSFGAYACLKAIRCGGAQHQPGTRLFVNFLPSTIYDPDAWLDAVAESLAQTALEPRDVVFEAVESERTLDVGHLLQVCERFRERGYACALDDVGTGTNSVERVAELRPDYIKLDKSLVWGLGSLSSSETVRKLVDLAAEFRAEVIAEGVETAAMVEQVSSFGVSLMQGYFLGHPSPEMRAVGSSLVALSTAVARAPVAVPKS